MALADDLGAESSSGALLKEFVVVLLDVDLFLNVLDAFNCDVACSLEAISNLEGMDALIKKLLSLLEESTSENNNTSGAVSNFVVLRFGKFNQKSCSLVLNFHLFKNGSSVVCDNNIAIRANR